MSARSTALAQASAVLAASALAGVLGKRALEDVTPFTFVWLQLAIGGVLLTVFTFGVRRERIPRGVGWRVWAQVAWIGVANFAVVRVLFLASLARLPATTHVYLVNFVGVVTMAMSVMILRERPSAPQVLGAVVALLGLWVFFPSLPPPEELTGVAQAGVGVLALASTNNVARRLALSSDAAPGTLVVSTVAVWIGGVPVVAAGLLTDWPPRLSAESLGIVALSGVVTIAIALTVWNHVLRTLRSYEASVLASTTVVFTALFAAPILGETIGARQLTGITLTLGGIALVQLRRPR